MASEAQALSDQLAGVVQAAAPSLVRVDARSRFGGTGLAWDGGVIVTASHTVRSEDDIGIGLPDGSTVAAALVGRDEATDVAVLRLSDEAGARKTGLKPILWSGGENIRVGSLVLALSRPGRTVRASLGVVSALGDGWRTRMGGKVDRYVETDVARAPGFSGGLLVDTAGHALGMNTGLGRHGPAITLPAATLERVVPALLAEGHVPRAYLGIGAYPVRIAGEKGGAGLIVLSVDPEGPARQAGVLQGDILAALDGAPIASLSELRSRFDEGTVSRAVRLSVLRAGQEREIEVKLGSR